MAYKYHVMIMLMVLFPINTLPCKTNGENIDLKVNTVIDENKPMFYEMHQAEIEKFKSGIKQLAIGDDKSKIIKILGEPTDFTAISGKKLDSAITGYMLEYSIKRLDDNLVNEKHDRYVVFILDKNHKLREIISKIK